MPTYYPKSERTEGFSERMKFVGEGVEALYELFDVLWSVRSKGVTKDTLDLSPVAEDIFDMFMVDELPAVHTEEYEYLPAATKPVQYERKLILRASEVEAYEALASYWLDKHSGPSDPIAERLAEFSYKTIASDKKIHEDLGARP